MNLGLQIHNLASFATRLLVSNSTGKTAAYRQPDWSSTENLCRSQLTALHFQLHNCERRQCGVDKIHCAALIQSQSDSVPAGGSECSMNMRSVAQSATDFSFLFPQIFLSIYIRSVAAVTRCFSCKVGRQRACYLNCFQ